MAENPSNTKQLTLGFLCSFGLIHLTKNGWHAPSVFISASRDFLNCAPKVGGFFLVSDAALMSAVKSIFKYLLPEVSISWTKSGLKVSLFLSRKPGDRQKYQ